MRDWGDVLTDLEHQGIACEPWGVRGDNAVERIQTTLAVQLTEQLSAFAREVGNLRIDPFDVCMGGDEHRQVGAVPATLQLRQRFGAEVPLSALQIMEHAGEVYLADSVTGAVAAFEALRPVRGEETLCWGSFEGFFEWLVKEAQDFQTGEELTF